MSVLTQRERECMLSTLKLILDQENMDYHQASVLQGVMFEHMDQDYAERLHQQNLHPYSQYVTNIEGRTEWVINTLTDEAREKIINPICQESFDSFEIRQKDNRIVHIIGRSLSCMERKNLLNEFYQAKPVKRIQVSFLTPTAFKQNGRYLILPDLRLFYQSLMMKYSASSTQFDMIDEDTLNAMVTGSFISSYRLYSRAFPMEHIWIPGFMGNMTISFSGKSTISEYIRLLLRFGEYSGVGIKTGMGMGAIHIMEDTSNERR